MGGSGFTESPEVFLKFFYGDENPQLEGVDITGLRSDDGTDNNAYYSGYNFLFSYLEERKSLDKALLDVATSLYEFLNSQMINILKGLELRYQKAERDGNLPLKPILNIGSVYPEDRNKRATGLNAMIKKIGAMTDSSRVISREFFEPIPGRPGRDLHGHLIS
jgi:hypothetical protein